ncbi:uncharacterized protein BX663DRAFT_435351, partial [Cokeromyces recurvatus]|uniref:uncharacterized protein n=1 Tax=Cokeromyces recurvatus TaxID=90255 RepID=UPI00221FD426
LSLTESELYNLIRDAFEILKIYFDIITLWKATNADYLTNCTFMDRSEFNVHQIRK